MAATIRNTVNYTVPPTQNTAPVLEFRCLYTHDLLKKQKKWHDGSVKFHTFNRRVMVYDDVKNYIGDLHYRQDEEFGEGLELQLDRPVKVEVGEPIGRTETDLAPLLDRGRGERDTRAAGNAHNSRQPVQRVNTASNTGKPRSLTDVLGASQGRLGRARLPVQSPYEQRQSLTSAPPIQRPLKKQRRTYGKENVSNEITFATLDPSTDAQSHTARINDSRSRVIGPSSVRAVVTPLESARSTDVQQQQSSRSPKPVHSKRTPARKSLERLSASGNGQTSPPTTVAKLSKASSRSVGNLPQQVHKTNVDNIEPSVGKSATIGKGPCRSDAAPIPTTVDRLPVTKLRFCAVNPRKKLMYKALLPLKKSSLSDMIDQNPSVREASRTSNPVSEAQVILSPENNHSVRSAAEDALVELVETSSSPLAPRSPRHICVQAKPPETVLISSSPMFMPAEDIFDMSQEFHGTVIDNEMDFMFTQNDEEADLTSKSAGNAGQVASTHSISQAPPVETDVVQITDGQHRNGSSVVIIQSDDRTETPPEKCENQVPDMITTPQSSVSCLTHSPKNMPDEQSTNYGMSNAIEAEMRDINSKKPPAIQRAVVSSPLLMPESPVKQNLQRSQSDSAALAQMKMASPITARPSQLEQPNPNDQGAWTKLEAFLLFDKWPAAKAKDKPDYSRDQPRRDDGMNSEFEDYSGIDGTIELSMDANVSSRVRSYRAGAATRLPGIRSARAVLRDEF